jgi:hypothetical protein
MAQELIAIMGSFNEYIPEDPTEVGEDPIANKVLSTAGEISTAIPEELEKMLPLKNRCASCVITCAMNTFRDGSV